MSFKDQFLSSSDKLKTIQNAIQPNNKKSSDLFTEIVGTIIEAETVNH
jgi:hypothetical protein